MPGLSLIAHCAAVEDPRQSWKVLFPLPEDCWAQVARSIVDDLLRMAGDVP